MALDGFSLTSSMRTNLQSLQATADLVARTQTRLSSGKKVNSPLDDPTNYFASKELSASAAALSDYKAGMGQAVQTIGSASAGIDGITKVLEAMQGVLASARATKDASQRGSLLASFTSLRQQIDGLASDAAYRGVALLRSQNLTVGLSTSSSLTITGVDATVAGLGISPVGASPPTVAGTGHLVSEKLNTPTYTGPTVTAGNPVTVSFNVGSGVSLSTLQDTLSVRIGSGCSPNPAPKMALTSVSLSGGVATATGTITNDANTGDTEFFDWGGGGMYASPTPYGERTFATGVIDGSISRVLVDGVAQGGSCSVGANGDIVFNPGSAPAVGTTVSYQTAAASDGDIEGLSSMVAEGLNNLRTYSVALSASLSVISVRTDFASAMVNALSAGSDELTLADMNEEGANMLALQTRQALGTNALRLSSEAEQAVLRLFQ